MAVKIRLTRTGSRNAACFRIVVADARSPRDGRFLENLGWYDPKMKTNNFSLKMDRVEYWTNEGAEASDTVKSLIRKSRKSGDDSVSAKTEEKEVVATVEPEEVAAPTAEENAVEESVAEETVTEEKVEA